MQCSIGPKLFLQKTKLQTKKVSQIGEKKTAKRVNYMHHSLEKNFKVKRSITDRSACLKNFSLRDN